MIIADQKTSVDNVEDAERVATAFVDSLVGTMVRSAPVGELAGRMEALCAELRMMRAARGER